MDPREIRQKGDRFALVFIFIFLFIRLGIIGPAQNSSPTSNPAEQIAIKAQARIKKIMGLAGDPWNDGPQPLGQDERGYLAHGPANSEPAGLAATTGPKLPEKIPQPSSQPFGVSPPSDLETQVKLLDLDLKYLDLEKEKTKKGKTYSLPIVNVAIDEETIFLLFPVFTFLGLLGLLKFRWDLLNNEMEILHDVPVWALPISYRQTDRSFVEWAFWNMAGITFHLLILYTVYEFAFSLQKAESYSVETTAVNALFLLITLAGYALSLIGAIRRDLKLVAKEET
jgi:hypothetical protein